MEQHKRGVNHSIQRTRSPIVICVTSNNGDRDSGKGSNKDSDRDNNRDSTGMCNNMVQDGVADGIPWRRLYLVRR